MNKGEALRDGYNEVKEFFGEERAKESLREYLSYRSEWIEKIGDGDITLLDRIAPYLICFSYSHRVNFESMVNNLSGVSDLSVRYKELIITPKNTTGDLIKSLLIGANVGGDKVILRDREVIVYWE